MTMTKLAKRKIRFPDIEANKFKDLKDVFKHIESKLKKDHNEWQDEQKKGKVNGHPPIGRY